MAPINGHDGPWTFDMPILASHSAARGRAIETTFPNCRNYKTQQKKKN